MYCYYKKSSDSVKFCFIMKHLINKRYFQKKLSHLGQKIEFIFSQLSFSKKFVLFSLIIILISLYIPWFHLSESNLLSIKNDSRNSFSHLLGNIGYFFFLCVVVNIFWILSSKNKKKIQYFSGFYFSESSLTLTIALSILGLSIHSYFLI